MSSDLYFNEFHTTIYLNVLRVSAFLSTCAFLVGTYLIVFQTPKRFGNYKWFMLNISISAYVFDIYTSLLYAPLPLFPILYACGLGPVRLLGQQYGGVYSYDLFIILFGITNISIIVAIAFRYAILNNYAHYLCSKIGIAVIAFIELTGALPIVFSRHWAIGDPVANRNKVAEIYPFAKRVLESEYCTGVSIDFSPVKTWIFMTNTFCGFFCAVPIALYLISRSFSMLNDFTSKMSVRTRRLHKQLLCSLFCQFVVPFVTLVVPFCILVVLASLRINTTTHYAQYIVLFGTFHSIGNTMMLITTIRPYRNLLLSALGKRVEPVSWLHTTKQSGIPNISNLSQIS